MKPSMRVRVRPLSGVAEAERGHVISSQRCLSVPHIGEAVDRANGLRELNQALARQEMGVEPYSRILHYGHELGRRCDTAEEPDQGRCLIVDWVPIEFERSDDEIDATSVATAAK